MMQRNHSVTIGKWCFFLGCSASLGACSLVLNYKECTDKSDCSGDDLICDNGYCVEQKNNDSDTSTLPQVELLTDDCTRLFGVSSNEKALSEDTILLGAILPYSGELSAKGTKIGQGIELAVDEINLTNGVLGKKIAVLFCDSGTDIEQTERVLEHLKALERIHAVLGPVASDVVVESFNDVAKDAGLLMMSPAATAPQISDLPDNNLLWRTAPSDAYQGRAIAAYLQNSAEGKRIAVVNRNDVYGNGLRDVIIEHLCETFPCTDDDRFYGAVYNHATLSTDQSKIIVELESFKPDITVLISYFDDGSSFLESAAQKGVERFFLADGMKSERLTSLDLPDDVLCRISGTQPASSTGTDYQSFELRFRAEYDEVGSYSANAYDAVYLLAYAYAAAFSRTADPEGSDLADGLGRLSSGETVNAGTSDWNKTIQTLSSNPDTTINYEGASGSLDFDEKGEAPSDIEGWTLDLDKGVTISLGTILTQDGAVFTDPFGEISAVGEVCDDVRNIECTNSTNCIEGDYCDLTFDPPICKAPPSGQGQACTEPSDCASFEADYCETMVSSTCLVDGCDPTLNNCSEGYHCCDFAWIGLPSLCVDELLSGGVCSTSMYECTDNSECPEGDYCDLAMEAPTCLAPPSGQGRACTSQEDCASFQADYCETMVSGTCLMQGCDKNLNNCTPGYQCCDFAWLELPNLCVDVVLSGGHCACSVDEDCKDGEYCDPDLNPETPVCVTNPPTGQGESCTTAEDCASFEADYCDLDMTSTCLRQGCSVDPNDCSVGYQCCDFSSEGLPALCVEESVYSAECPL